MKSLVTCSALLLLFATGFSLTAAPPSPEEIAKAIKQLGDDSFDVREKATTFLRSAGQVAEAALREATQSTDKEVARRAGEVLEDFKWGIYPETPRDVVAIINRYRSGDNETRNGAVKDLLKFGAPGFQSLRKIALAEEDKQVRALLFETMVDEASTAAGKMLIDGNEAALEDFLELCLLTSSDTAEQNYTALLLLRKRLDEKIPVLKAKVENKDLAAAKQLTHLYRAKGDLAGARWAAERANNSPLVTAVMIQQGDWKGLAAKDNEADHIDEYGVEAAAYRIAYNRLAGNKKEVDKQVADLLKNTEESGSGRTGSQAAKALLLNDHPKEAQDLLLKGKHLKEAVDILAAQMKYTEAFEIADKMPEDTDSDIRLAVWISKARNLYILGENDKAIALFAKTAEKLRESQYPSIERDLIRVQMRVGLKDQAFENAGKILAQPRYLESRWQQLLDLLFPDQTQATSVWWEFFRRKFRGDQPGATLTRLRDLIENKLPAKDFDKLVEEFEKDAELQQTKEQTGSQLIGLAETFSILGKDALAKKYFLKAFALPYEPADALQSFADILAKEKSWKEAAQRYKQSWDKDPSQPLTLFLYGAALIELKQEAQGKKCKELAHWIPLGNDARRHEFGKELAQRGYLVDAERERNLIIQLSMSDGWALTETLRQSAYMAMRKKDFTRAAELFEQFRLRCLQSRLTFTETTANVQVPAMAHQSKARVLLAAGKLDEARQEIAVCINLAPANVNLPIQLIADLEKANRKKEADELFQQVFTVHEKLCKDYPKSGTNNNSLAWLGATCHRELDKAEQAARRAVELEPKNAGWMDTLAEVLFQRGQTAKALDIMKQCAELEPKNDYFKKQLKRFEAGDPKAELPDENE